MRDLGPGLYPTKPLSSFLFGTYKFTRGHYGLDIHSVKKIQLLDFSIHRLWGKSQKILGNVSILYFFQSKI